MELDERVEGVLFYRATPMKIEALARFFDVSEAEMRKALGVLNARLTAGIRLVCTDTEAVLMTAPDLATTIEALRKDDSKRDIGKAGAETLAIIAYRGPLARADIDGIRGVNSTFILRNLLIRGLIERKDNPHNQRSFLYQATPALFAHLGISVRESLPQFAEIMDALDRFESQQEAGKTDEHVFSENV